MSDTTASPRTRRIMGAGVIAAAALATAGVTGASPAAAAPAPIPASYDYASWAIGVPPDTATISDCRVWVGPVRDPWVAYPNYRKIAGVEVACSTRKPVIEAYVYLQKWEGGRWVQKGTRGYGILVGTFGSNGWKKGSQGICGGRGFQRRTLAQVRIGSGVWWNVASQATTDPAGC